jgi:hypothetical protein
VVWPGGGVGEFFAWEFLTCSLMIISDKMYYKKLNLIYQIILVINFFLIRHNEKNKKFFLLQCGLFFFSMWMFYFSMYEIKKKIDFYI